MHLSSAALLLLLAPATRAAAIPNQGDLFGAGDALINKGDHVDGAANLLAPIGDAHAKFEGTVSEAARRGTTGSDDNASGINTIEYVGTISEAATKALAGSSSNHIDGTRIVPNGRRNVADPLAPPTAAAYGEAALEDPLADLVAQIAKANLQLSLEEVKALAAVLANSDGVGYEKRDGEDPLADVAAQIAKANPNLSLDEVKVLAEALTNGDGVGYVKRDGEDPLADVAAQIAKANPNLSLDEAKVLAAALTSGYSAKYVKRDGEDPLAGLIAHIAKENPNLSLEEVKDLVAAMAEGVGAKYVKRDGEVVTGGLGETVGGAVNGVWYVVHVTIDNDELYNRKARRDTTGDNIDATTETAAGVVGEVGGAGVKGAAENKEAKVDNVKAYYVNKHTGEVRKLSPEEIKKLTLALKTADASVPAGLGNAKAGDVGVLDGKSADGVLAKAEKAVRADNAGEDDPKAKIMALLAKMKKED